MSLATLRHCGVGVSLLVAVTLLSFNVRSYRVGDHLALARNAHVAGTTHSRVFNLTTGPGELLLTLTHAQRPAGAWPKGINAVDQETPGLHFKWDLQPLGSLVALGWDRTFLSRRGFLFESRASQLGPAATARTFVAAPFWSVVLPFALPPAVHLLRRYCRDIRHRRGLCPHCGYDVRTTPAKCPECGLPPQSPSRSPFQIWAGRVALAAACVTIATAVTLGGRSADLPVVVETPSFARASPPPTSPPTAPVVLPASRASQPPVSQTRGTIGSPPSVVLIRPGQRELARQIDRTRTYVFLPGNKGGRTAQLRHQIASVETFAYRGDRWHVRNTGVRAGQSVGTPEYPSDLRVKALNDTGTDLCVTFIDAAGNETVRSSNADLKDPVRLLLLDMTSYSGQALARELFPPP